MALTRSTWSEQHSWANITCSLVLARLPSLWRCVMLFIVVLLVLVCSKECLSAPVTQCQMLPDFASSLYLASQGGTLFAAGHKQCYTVASTTITAAATVYLWEVYHSLCRTSGYLTANTAQPHTWNFSLLGSFFTMSTSTRQSAPGVFLGMHLHQQQRSISLRLLQLLESARLVVGN